MNLTAEQLQIASMIDAKVKSIGRPSVDDFTIFAEMADYLPAFKRLMDTSKHAAVDELYRRFAGFFHCAKILERVAAGIQSGPFRKGESDWL
jgi:hypothetical protein